jgi:hypothetical protein
MVRARSAAALIEEKKKVGDGYSPQLVFAARMFELRPNEKASAMLLLNLIPKDDGQHALWMTLGDSLCNGESMSDIRSLGQLRDRLPRNVAKAVLLVPEKLAEYAAYSLTATQDPHSDYALQMVAVCRARHQQFIRSLDGLPREKRDWFALHVLNPEGCRALAIPEAR